METVNGVPEGDKGGPPPPSPLTGCYLLIVVGEPYTEQHKDIILQRIAKGLLSWEMNSCLVDLEKELAIITEQALEGEEARYGERLIQFASENLVTEILIHPVVSTLAQCMRNLLSSFTRHRHIIHSGYTFAANGSWALQDGTFSYSDFSEAFQEIDVQRVIHAYENGISLDLHCSPEGDWTRLPKEQFAKACKARVNPTDVLTSGSPAIASFTNYLAPFLVPTSLGNLLESSDVVGNIRFSRPTLYVFPGGQGDAALFGINGFNMLLDGGFSRKACFWDFVRHLDRLDAVLMTRLNNSNVGGISSVLRRKKQDAVYPQLGHFFCNIQERRSLLSPDGDKDKDPLLINLLDEGQEIISNLRHLNLNPQVCYRDSEPINLYHKVGHGTLDMYVLSPAKDSKEVREFLQKWNQCDQKLFANSKSSREFSFPIQNLISIAALLVWQPADPNDTITRILFPGSSPQNKIFEGLDKLKNLEFIKHSVCTERSLVPISITKKTAKDPLLEKVTPKEKTPVEKKDIKIIENNILSAVNGDIKEKEKTVKKSDSTESDRSTKTKKTEEARITENGDKSKPKVRTSKSRSGSQQRKKAVEKKASPTTPKKIVENGESKKPSKPSPISTPAKSAKDANNRKVIESKAKREGVLKPQQPPEPKPKAERKPISRRPVAKKAPLSPAKKLVSGVQKPDSISRKGKLDKEGTTDSSTVSTPSADQETVLKKDLSKLTPDELQQLKAQELADLKEEQEAIKEIEAVFRKGESVPVLDDTLRKVRDESIDEKLNKEEYLIVEKEEVEHESLSDAKENETQKLARDSEESEKQRKLSCEDKIEDISAEMKKESQVEDIGNAKVDALESSKVSLEDKLDISTDKKTNEKEVEDDVKDVMESQPDEKISANIKSGDTTTAPTLPEDERIPLDEIKEDNGHVIEEKYVKEETKEKEIPVIQLPQKQLENISKLPGAVGIRLDKQQLIRDIVKTPDEVADLPVHEEVDYEYTHELKVETPKSNEVIEKQFEVHDHSKTLGYNKEQEKGIEQEKDKDEVVQEMSEEIENIKSFIPESGLIVRDDGLKGLEADVKRGLDEKEESKRKIQHEPIADKDVEIVPIEVETPLDDFQTKNIAESHAEEKLEIGVELKKEIKPSEEKDYIDEGSEHVEKEQEKLDSTTVKGEEDTKHVPCEPVQEKVSEKPKEENIPDLPTVMEVKSEQDRINKGVLKAAKEDRHHLEKLDEKLQQLKQSQMEVEEDERNFSTIQSETSVDISKDVEKSIEKTTDEIMEDFIREDAVGKSQPKSPIEIIEKGDLGRKSPKEREEDVIKIVASVAEVLKSDAPLEEFEGKLPITTTISSYVSPYTTELRETHITTVDSPVIEYKVIKTDIPTIPEEPHIASASFIEEEKKISEVYDSREEKPEDKKSSLLKESQELMMTTSRMISDIKSAKPEEIVQEVSAEKVDGVDSITAADEKIEEEESGVIHRMLVTASSEDGGEEIEICPPGTIIFPRSSESSGRSSPDPSQKLSQKSSVVETISDTLSTVKQIADLESEKESGIVGKAEETIIPLPELKSTELSDGLSAALEKSDEISSQMMTSGKSSPDKDASIKSLASGKSTPDMSDLDKFKEVTSSSEDLKKDDESKSIKEPLSEISVSVTHVGETDVETQTIASTDQKDLRLEQSPPEEIPQSEIDLGQKSVVDIVEGTFESGIAAVTEFTKSIFISDEGNDEKVSDHIADKEITKDVTATLKEEINGEIPTHETDDHGISGAMTQSAILDAKDTTPSDQLSHYDKSKVLQETEVSVEVDKHIAEVEVSKVESLVEGIGRRIGVAFDAVAEYIHPASDQINVTEPIEKTTGPDEVTHILTKDEKQKEVNEEAALKSPKVEFTEKQRETSPPEEEHEKIHVSHEVSHLPQDTDQKVDHVIDKTEDDGHQTGKGLKVSLDVEDLDVEAKKDRSHPLQEKDILQDNFLGEEIAKPDTATEKSLSEESIIASKSPTAIEKIETTTVSVRESPEKSSEPVQLKTDIEDSKPVLEVIQKTEIIKTGGEENEAVESMSESVDDLLKKKDDIVKEFPPSQEKHAGDILESKTADDISDKLDHKINSILAEKPTRDEEQLAKQTEEIDSSPEIHETIKPGADIPCESDYKIKDTSTILSKQLDEAESEIPKYILAEKSTTDEKHSAEQTEKIDSSPEDHVPVTSGSPEIPKTRKVDVYDTEEQLNRAESEVSKDVSADKLKREEQTEEINSSTDTDGAPDIYKPKKPDDIPDTSDHKIESTTKAESEQLDEAESEISKLVSAEKPTTDEKPSAESTKQVDPPDDGSLEIHELKKLSSEVPKNLLIADKEKAQEVILGATSSVHEGEYILEKSQKEEEHITAKMPEDEEKRITVDVKQSEVTPKETTEAPEDKDKPATTGVKNVLEVVKHDVQNIAEEVSGVITSEVESTKDEINTFKEDFKTLASSLYDEVKDISKGMLDEAKKMFDETTYSISAVPKDTDPSIENLQDESGVMKKPEDLEKNSKEAICLKDVNKSVAIEPTQVAEKPFKEGPTDTSEVSKKFEDSKSPVRESISDDEKHGKGINEESKDPQKETFSEISSLPLSVQTRRKESVSNNEMVTAIEQHKEAVTDISDLHLVVSKGEEIVHDESLVEGDLKSSADGKIPEIEKIAENDEKLTKDVKSGDDGSKSQIASGTKTPEPDEGFEEQPGKIRIDTIQDVDGILQGKAETIVDAVQFDESSVPAGINEETKGRTSDLGTGVENVVTDVIDVSEIITPYDKEITEPITKYEQPRMKETLESPSENIEETKLEILKETSDKLKDTMEKVEDMGKSILLDKSQKLVTEVVTVEEETSPKGKDLREHHEMKKGIKDDSATTHGEVVDSTKVQEVDDSTKVSKQSQKESLSESTCKEPSDEAEVKKEVTQITEVMSKSKDSETVESSKSESPEAPIESADEIPDAKINFVEDLKAPIITPHGIGKSGEEILEREKVESEKSTRHSEVSSVEDTTGSAVSNIHETEKQIETAVDSDEILKDESQQFAGKKRFIEQPDIKQKIDAVEELSKSEISGKYVTEEPLISDDSIKTSKENQHGKSDAEKDVDEIECCKDVTDLFEVKLEQSASNLEKMFETVQDLSRSVIFETCDSRDKKDDDQKLGEVLKDQEKTSKDSAEEPIKSLERRKSVVDTEKKQEEHCEKSDEEKQVDEEKKSDQATNDVLKHEKILEEPDKLRTDTTEEKQVDEEKKSDQATNHVIKHEKILEEPDKLRTDTPEEKQVDEDKKSDQATNDVIKHEKILEEPDKLRTDTPETIQDMPQFEEHSKDPEKILMDIHHELSNTKTEDDIGKESILEKSLLEKTVVPETSVEICEQAGKLSTDIYHEKSDVEMIVGVDPTSEKVIQQEMISSEKSDKILKDTTEAVPVFYEETCEETEKLLTGLRHEKSETEEQINVGEESKQERSSQEKSDKLMKDSSEGLQSMSHPKDFESGEKILGKTKEIVDAHDVKENVSEAVSERKEVIFEKSDELPKDTSKTAVMPQSIVTGTSERSSDDLHHEKSDTKKPVDLGEEPKQGKSTNLEMQDKILKESSEAEKTEITSVDVKPDYETKVIVDTETEIEKENKSLEKPDKILKDTSEAVSDILDTTGPEVICGASEETLTGVHYEKSDAEKIVDSGSEQGVSAPKKPGKSINDNFEEFGDISQSVAAETTEGACQKIEEILTDLHHEESLAARRDEVDPRSDEITEKAELIIGKAIDLLKDTSEAVKDKPLSSVPGKSVGICEEFGETSESVHHEKSDAEKKVDAGDEAKQEDSIVEKSEKLLEDRFEKVQVLSHEEVSESCKNLQKFDTTDKEKSDPEKDVEIASESGENVEPKETLLKSTVKESKEISESTSGPIIFEKCEYAQSNKSIADKPIVEKQENASTKKVSETLGQVGETSVDDLSTRKDNKREESDAMECKEKSIEPIQKWSDTIEHKSVELEKGEEETMEKCDKECKPDSSTTQLSTILDIADQKSRVEDLGKTPTTLAGPSIAEKSETNVQKEIDIQESLLHEKHIPGAVTPPTVPVSPNILDETTKFTAGSQSLMKEVDLRSITPVSDDSEIIGSTQTDISEQASKVHLDKESDDDDQLSIMSQIAHSRDSSHCEFDDELRKVDPMSMSVFGSLPGETSSEPGPDPSILVETEKTKIFAPSADKTDVKLAESIDSGSSYIDDKSSSSIGQEKKDPLESWGKPLELPAPTYLYEITQAKFSRGVHSISLEEKGSAIGHQSESEEEGTHHFRHEQLDVMSASFYGDLPSDEKDPLSSWGKPLGLPSPAPPNDNKGTPKKERKLPPNVSAKNKLNDDRKRAESPSKYNNRNKKITPVYVDLTYVPHHGNTHYSYVDFFKRVRARYYVFSGIEPSRDVYNALLEAKQTWEDKDLEVTIIPTYDTDILGYWVAENEELLSKYKIDLSPSASRCTINLQDHETSCSAYRLEF